MSTNAAFKLQDAGFSRQQVEALGEFLDTQAATKTDLIEATGALKTELGETKAELKAEIAATKADLKADLAATEHRLDLKVSGVRSDVLVLKWMVGFVLTFQVVIFIKLMLH